MKKMNKKKNKFGNLYYFMEKRLSFVIYNFQADSNKENLILVWK